MTNQHIFSSWEIDAIYECWIEKHDCIKCKSEWSEICRLFQKTWELAFEEGKKKVIKEMKAKNEGCI